MASPLETVILRSSILLTNLVLDVNAKDKGVLGTSHYAVSGGSPQVVEWILQLPPVIYADFTSWSSLHWATKNGNMELIKL